MTCLLNRVTALVVMNEKGVQDGSEGHLIMD